MTNRKEPHSGKGGNYDGIYKDILQIDGYFYLKDL